MVCRTSTLSSAAPTGSRGGDRDLELPGGVLRVELLDGDPLPLERPDHLAAVVGQLDHPGHAVGRARSTGPGPKSARPSRSVPRPTPPRSWPAVQAALERPRRSSAGERALAAGVARPPGCSGRPAPTPTRAARRARDPVKIGDQPQVPAGPPMCLLVVMSSLTRKTSNTGDIPMPHPAARSSAQRDGLDPGDARVIHPAQTLDPVIAVVADGADELVFGDIFYRGIEIGSEPILRGNGAGGATGIVFVVVHDDDAINGSRDCFVVVVLIAYLHTHIQLHALGVEVGGKFLKQCEVAGLGF